MTVSSRMQDGDYNEAPIIKGKQTVWFLNGDLVKVFHSSRSTGMITVYNIIKDRQEIMLKKDFLRNREKAYNMGETAKLINRHKKYLPSLIKRGVIPPPLGAQKGGGRAYQVRAYYSESQIREIREILASIHIGGPRKDGLITNNLTPTSQELTRRMGEGILSYTRTEDGRFIPIWNESI